MKLYDIYSKDDENLFIKEGFSIYAAILQFFWSGYHKIWDVTLILLILNISLLVIESYISIGVIIILNISLTIYAAINAVDWRCNDLSKKGFKYNGRIYAENESHAEYLFYRQNKC